MSDASDYSLAQSARASFGGRDDSPLKKVGLISACHRIRGKVELAGKSLRIDADENQLQILCVLESVALELLLMVDFIDEAMPADAPIDEPVNA